MDWTIVSGVASSVMAFAAIATFIISAVSLHYTRAPFLSVVLKIGVSDRNDGTDSCLVIKNYGYSPARLVDVIFDDNFEYCGYNIDVLQEKESAPFQFDKNATIVPNQEICFFLILNEITTKDDSGKISITLQYKSLKFPIFTKKHTFLIVLGRTDAACRCNMSVEVVCDGKVTHRGENHIMTSSSYGGDLLKKDRLRKRK